MTIDEAIRCLSVHSNTNGSGLCTDKQHFEAKQMAIEALEQITKIADIVDGTIDHFDRDDAMDMLYEIKGVIK